MSYYLCHECACEVVNGDPSGRDFTNPSESFDTEQEWLDWNASRDAPIEAMGLVSHVGTKNIGVFTCFVDSDCHYGDAEIFENV